MTVNCQGGEALQRKVGLRFVRFYIVVSCEEESESLA